MQLRARSPDTHAPVKKSKLPPPALFGSSTTFGSSTSVASNLHASSHATMIHQHFNHPEVEKPLSVRCGHHVRTHSGGSPGSNLPATANGLKGVGDTACSISALYRSACVRIDWIRVCARYAALYTVGDSHERTVVDSAAVAQTHGHDLYRARRSPAWRSTPSPRLVRVYGDRALA